MKDRKAESGTQEAEGRLNCGMRIADCRVTPRTRFLNSAIRNWRSLRENQLILALTGKRGNKNEFASYDEPNRSGKERTAKQE